MVCFLKVLSYLARLDYLVLYLNCLTNIFQTNHNFFEDIMYQEVVLKMNYLDVILIDLNISFQHH